MAKAPGAQYEILHNGIPRTYRDDKQFAIEAAIYAKQRCPRDEIELHDMATGQRQRVLPDGRLG
jgi:hypothetical protein